MIAHLQPLECVFISHLCLKASDFLPKENLNPWFVRDRTVCLIRSTSGSKNYQSCRSKGFKNRNYRIRKRLILTSFILQDRSFASVGQSRWTTPCGPPSRKTGPTSLVPLQPPCLPFRRPRAVDRVSASVSLKYTLVLRSCPLSRGRRPLAFLLLVTPSHSPLRRTCLVSETASPLITERHAFSFLIKCTLSIFIFLSTPIFDWAPPPVCPPAHF